jgi:hypothetical protein
MSNASRWWLHALLAAGTLSVVPPARAQQKEPHREGFWIGVGLGYGSAGISCSSCRSDHRLGSSAATIRIGGTLSSQLLLGGEIDAWNRSESGVTETVGDVSAVLYYYPRATGTVFLKAGVGAVVYNATTSPTIDAEGSGVSVGAGIDLYVGRTFSLTPYIDFVTAVSGHLKVEGMDTGVSVRPNLIQIGVAATWH